jgi:hypothetical protein
MISVIEKADVCFRDSIGCRHGTRVIGMNVQDYMPCSAK